MKPTYLSVSREKELLGNQKRKYALTVIRFDYVKEVSFSTKQRLM